MASSDGTSLRSSFLNLDDPAEHFAVLKLVLQLHQTSRLIYFLKSKIREMFSRGGRSFSQVHPLFLHLVSHVARESPSK